MKKIIAGLLVLTLCLGLAGCSGITQEQYDSAVSEISQANDDVSKLTDELECQISTLKATQDEKEKLQSEYDAYKEKMKPFEAMTAAQAEAEKLKAEEETARLTAEKEAKDAEEKAAAEAAAAEEASRKAEEEARGYETGITFDQLARTPDDYITQKVKFSGKVLQVMEGSGFNQIRLAIDSDYDQIILAEYDPSLVSSRILEDDIITIYGYSMGVTSYTSTLRKTITLPCVIVDKIDLE